MSATKWGSALSVRPAAVDVAEASRKPKIPSFPRRRESRVRSPNPRRMDSRLHGNDGVFKRVARMQSGEADRGRSRIASGLRC